MNKNIGLGILLGLGMVALPVEAQNVYELTAPKVEKIIYTKHLKLGGTAPDGGSIEVNSFYMLRNGKPMLPVTGEFHYSRYPAEQWEQAILKMKAGGLTIIPTYVFWNIHEEKEGVFDWNGNRDLRRFVELCKKHDMDVIVRIGPFCHGEIRNGGLPDWLFARPVEVRSNDGTSILIIQFLQLNCNLIIETFYILQIVYIIGAYLYWTRKKPIR